MLPGGATVTGTVTGVAEAPPDPAADTVMEPTVCAASAGADSVTVVVATCPAAAVSVPEPGLTATGSPGALAFQVAASGVVPPALLSSMASFVLPPGATAAESGQAAMYAPAGD